MYGDGELEVSEGWRQIRDLSTTTDPNISSAVHDEDHLCKFILYKEIKDSKIRIWDVIILIPNLLFIIFIAIRFNRARLKLRATSSPIYLAFYGLVICSVVISFIRCVVSMIVSATASVAGPVDKVLWVIVRFFLLSTEMSVVIFSIAFGRLDSHSSIRRVLLATSFIALVFTITQGTLELVLPDDTFHIPSRDFYVFGHGGMMFWFCSSIVFTMIYLFVLILRYTRLRERLLLPSRNGFYVYVSLLAILDLVQSIGAGLLNWTQNPAGLCVVDITSGIYLTLFTPLVYHIFLSGLFGVSQPSISFSYKAQVDDAMDEDTVSLPHQQSFSSLKTDSDYIYQVHTPCFYSPLFHSQCLGQPYPNQNRLASSSSHASILFLDYAAQRRFHLRSHLNVQTSAPNLTALTSSTSAAAVASTSAQPQSEEEASSLLLSPSTSSEFLFSGSKSNLLVNKSESSMTITSTSPKLESSLQSILNNEGESRDEKTTEDKKSDVGLSEYLRNMRSSGRDDDDDNEVEVKMLMQQKSGDVSTLSSSSSSSSQSEAL